MPAALVATARVTLWAKAAPSGLEGGAPAGAPVRGLTGAGVASGVSGLSAHTSTISSEDPDIAG